MNGHPPELERIQRWMQAVITHPAGIAAGVESVEARRHLDVAATDVERVIRPSQALDSVKRLAIYGSAYYSRLIECLAAEFPAVRAAVGDEGFAGFVTGFLQQFPSTSYTLSDLGRAFPQYLAESRPPRTSGDPDWADFLVDLATLERTYSEVFDGPGEEAVSLLKTEDLLAIPPKGWGDARLRTAASLRLLELRFPAHEYASAVRHRQEPTCPAPKSTRLAISRRGYVVRRRPLSPFPYRLLGNLQQGCTLQAALEESVATTDADLTDLPACLEKWFSVWTREGYFAGVEIENGV